MGELSPKLSCHRIVCNKLTISLRTQQKQACKHLKFHYELLKDEATQIKYNIELRNKFSALRTIDPETQEPVKLDL